MTNILPEVLSVESITTLMKNTLPVLLTVATLLLVSILTNVGVTSGPVSYTHLDVYKRQIQKTGTTGFRTNNVQTLTYFQDFGRHNVNVMVGHEYYRATTKYLAATAKGGFSPDIPEINAFATKNDEMCIRDSVFS